MLQLTTPAMLFPAISLLMLAYTNRFITLAGLVRELKEAHDKNPSENLIRQIQNLSFRLNIIQYMQIMGALSFLFCAFSMFGLALDHSTIGLAFFLSGLAFLVISLGLLIVELLTSVKALKIVLKNIED